MGSFTVSADGQRFLISLPIHDFDEDPFRVLLNWQPTR